MASLNISQDELKALEQTRQRLQQVSDSIGTLKNDVFNSNPLPNLYVAPLHMDSLVCKPRFRY